MRGLWSTLSWCNDLSELNPSDQMFDNSWEGCSASVHTCSSTEVYRKPSSPQETIQQAVRTTHDKMQAQHTDENSFWKQGCFGRPLLLGLHLLVFFHLIRLISLFHLSFNPLLSFFSLSTYFFPHSRVYCFLTFFPFLPAACQWKVTQDGNPGWQRHLWSFSC